MSLIVFFCSCLGLFCLLLGCIIGLSWGRRLAARDRREDAAAELHMEALRPLPELAFTRPGRTSSRSQNARAKQTSTAAFLDPPGPNGRPTERIPLEYRPLLDRIEGIGTPIWAPRPRTDEEAARDAWSEHVDQALGLANGDPITTGEIRAITEDMDVFMGRLLGEHPVPYPDGSGQ